MSISQKYPKKEEYYFVLRIAITISFLYNEKCYKRRTILRTKTNNSFVHTVSFVYVRQPKGCTYTKREKKAKVNRGNKAEYSGNEKWQKFKK